MHPLHCTGCVQGGRLGELLGWFGVIWLQLWLAYEVRLRVRTPLLGKEGAHFDFRCPGSSWSCVESLLVVCSISKVSEVVAREARAAASVAKGA